MDRSYRPLIVTLVVLGVLVLLGSLAFTYIVRTITSPEAAGTAVSVEAQVMPEGDGLRVMSTVTALDGALPDQVDVPRVIRNGYVRDPAGSMHIPTESLVTDITVDGAAVEPGAAVSAGGAELTVSYLIHRDNTGVLVGTIAAPVSDVDTRRLTVTSTGASLCMQPLKDFVVSDPTHMITTACDSPAVATPDPLEPDSTQPLPVWIRLHY